MNVLIVEDEKPAAKHLQSMVKALVPNLENLSTVDSVKTAVKWLRQTPNPDLIFMDIQLADGISFDIFHEVEILSPIIFTTAFDQYTLQAFKHNSIDYLLKPIEETELDKALQKLFKLQNPKTGMNKQLAMELLQSLQKPACKERFLVKNGQQLFYIPTVDIQYFYTDAGLLYCRLENGKKHVLDMTLDLLETKIDPQQFFRINRQIIIRPKAILKMHTYINGRLKVEMKPALDLEVIVARGKVNDFKEWLDG